jgi:hypothetical protein
MIVLWTNFLSKLRIDLSFLDCGEGQTPSIPGIIYAFLNSEKKTDEYSVAKGLKIS